MITTKTLSTDKIIGADFNDANILRGKRRCEAVDDYRNSSLRKDALFGGFADEEGPKSTMPRRKRELLAKEESRDDGTMVARKRQC